MTLDEQIEQVQRDHEQRRLECRTLPKKRKGRRERLRPDTALIAEAAHAKMMTRIAAEPQMDDVPGRTTLPLKRGA